MAESEEKISLATEYGPLARASHCLVRMHSNQCRRLRDQGRQSLRQLCIQGCATFWKSARLCGKALSNLWSSRLAWVAPIQAYSLSRCLRCLVAKPDVWAVAYATKPMQFCDFVRVTKARQGATKLQHCLSAHQKPATREVRLLLSRIQSPRILGFGGSPDAIAPSSPAA